MIHAKMALMPILCIAGMVRYEKMGIVTKKAATRTKISRNTLNLGTISAIFYPTNFVKFVKISSVKDIILPSIHGPKNTIPRRTAAIFGINAKVCS